MARTVPPQTTAFDAEYALESPLKCPQCREEIATVQVVRLLRSRVNFISTMPRRGHAIVCPACRTMISAELGGIA